MLDLGLLLEEIRVAGGASFLGVYLTDGAALAQSGLLALSSEPGQIGALVAGIASQVDELYQRVDIGRQVILRVSGSTSELWMEPIGQGLLLLAALPPSAQDDFQQVLAPRIAQIQACAPSESAAADSAPFSRYALLH